MRIEIPQLAAIQQTLEFSTVPIREALTIISGAVCLINERPSQLNIPFIYEILVYETNYFDVDKKSHLFRAIVSAHSIHTQLLHQHLHRILCERMDEADLEAISLLRIDQFAVTATDYRCRFSFEIIIDRAHRKIFNALIKVSRDFKQCRFVHSHTDVKLNHIIEVTTPVNQANRRRLYCCNIM